MKQLKKYGNAPFNIAVIHGGPGAHGEMAPVAKELAKNYGVLEPFQTKNSIDGQVKELRETLEQNKTSPIKLVGWSWGAWLSYIFTAHFPEWVEKLILVSSGPFEENYTKQVAETRLKRLNKEAKTRLRILENLFNDPDIKNKDAIFAQFGKLFEKTDSYNPINIKSEIIKVQFNIYQSVWREAAKLRKSGKLLKLGKKINCPVVAIHGDYDSHPYQGVKEPLSRTLKNFKFILLKECGHHPWLEKNARERFYKILKKELKDK